MRLKGRRLTGEWLTPFSHLIKDKQNLLQNYEGKGGKRRGANSIREQLVSRIPPRSRLLTLTRRRMAFARLLDKYIHIFPAPVATANQSQSEDDDDEPGACDEFVTSVIAH
jgi:hypothetical protein